jgi:hypothetical protein
MGKEIIANTTEERLEHHHHKKAHRQHIEGGKTPMHQHFVHHHLKEQGRDQGKDLQEKGDDQDFSKDTAILYQGGNKPRNIEGVLQAFPQTLTPSEGNELTRPTLFKVV